jgi:hypothetical protein
MLALTEGQERQVLEAAAGRGEPPEETLARAVALGLAQLAAAAQQGLEPAAADGRTGEGDGDGGDAYRPPFGAAAAAERGMEMPGRGHVPEPKAPRLFRARTPDGVAVHGQIAFGPEPGPSLSVAVEGRHAWTDVIVPLHWVLIDLRPVAWDLVFRAVEDAARRLRAGEPVPPRYGADPAWGYPGP